MATSPLDRVKDMYAAMHMGDFNPFLELMDEQVRWHLPGSSPYAGTTNSRDELVSRMLRQSEASGGTSRLELVDAMGHGNLVVATETLHSRRGDRTLRAELVVVYRFAGERVVEAWDHFSDEPEYDSFWG